MLMDPMLFRLVHEHQNRRLLHNLRRRLHRREKRVGRVRNLLRHADEAPHNPPPHLHLPLQRGDRAGERDVRRDRRRPSGGDHGVPDRVGRADKNRGGERSVREERVRERDEAPHDEVGVLDDRELQGPRG